MLKFIIIILLIGIITLIGIELTAGSKYVLDCNADLLNRSEEIAYAQLGTIEAGNRNDGDVVKYLHAVGLEEGSPYCAAGQYYCFMKAAEDLEYSLNAIPILRTGLANGVFNHAKKTGVKAKYEANRHDLIVWRKRNSWSGHIERVIEVHKAGWVKTIGFNTYSSDGKRQGVFIKKRNIYHPLTRMPVRGLVGFNSIPEGKCYQR